MSRTEMVFARVNPSERAVIEIAAASDGSTISAFLRKVTIRSARQLLEIDEPDVEGEENACRPLTASN